MFKVISILCFVSIAFGQAPTECPVTNQVPPLMIPDPADCGLFFMCHYGNKLGLSCESNMVFDFNRQTCVVGQECIPVVIATTPGGGDTTQATSDPTSIATNPTSVATDPTTVATSEATTGPTTEGETGATTEPATSESTTGPTTEGETGATTEPATTSVAPSDATTATTTPGIPTAPTILPTPSTEAPPAL